MYCLLKCLLSSHYPNTILKKLITIIPLVNDGDLKYIAFTQFNRCDKLLL